MPESLPASNALLTLDHLLCFAIYSANHAINRAYKPLLNKLGLTYPQYIVMVVLWEQDRQTVTTLGEKLCLASNTLTPLLKRLEKMHHVTRQRDPDDERQVLIYLTQQGRELSQDVANIQSCIMDATGLTSKNVGYLQAQISLLRRNLEATAKTVIAPCSR